LKALPCADFKNCVAGAKRPQHNYWKNYFAVLPISGF